MLMSPLNDVEFAPDYPDLAGMRVLITGISGALGIEIARSFADQRTRLVLQAAEDGPETNAMAEIVAQSAADVRLFSGPLADSEAMVRFARTAVQAFDGVDAVINLAQCGEPPRNADERAVEGLVTAALTLPCLMTRIAINRMRTTMMAGTILNIATESRRASPAARAVAGVARAALTSMTRTEARAAAADGIRVNAIAPGGPMGARDSALRCDPDVASLAMHLVSKRGSRLSGLVFEAYAG